jgi:Uma2 family endonuclease
MTGLRFLPPRMQRASIIPMAREAVTETIPVPATVRFPIELTPPASFEPADPASWPDISGRLEWVDGRLLYMPPCGDVQQGVSVGVATVLGTWGEERPEFFIGGNEAGMLLGEDVRGAEGAVWRREAVVPLTGGYVRMPPILAVEVAGREEGEPELREKARWYLGHGVAVVWLVLPASREVVVIRAEGESRHEGAARLPPHPLLPGLLPSVERFFRQLG